MMHSIENVMALLDLSDDEWDGLSVGLQMKLQSAISVYEAVRDAAQLVSDDYQDEGCDGCGTIRAETIQKVRGALILGVERLAYDLVGNAIQDASENAPQSRKFEVVLVSKAQDTYIVEAEDEEEAYHIARDRFAEGEDGDLAAGSDYQSVENFEVKPL